MDDAFKSKAAPADKRDRFDQQLLSATLSYVEAFSDVAEVAVPGCDGPTSRSAAEEALQAVLDFLHVRAGAAYTKKMRGVGPALGADRRSLIVRVDGKLELTHSVAWGGANIAEEAWRELAEPDGQRYLAPLGAAIQQIVERRPLNLLAERFIEACSWYGDAVRDPSPAAAAVKYVTVMERLLWTGEDRGVTRRVSERLAALCFRVDSWNFDALRLEVVDAYDLRSGLLHGRISRADPQVATRLHRCERNARELLLAWYDRYGDGFSAEIDLARLRTRLNAFTAEVIEITASRADAIGDHRGA